MKRIHRAVACSLAPQLPKTRVHMASSAKGIKYLSQVEAQKVDDALMGPDLKFNVHQLMELAGLSVAQAVGRVYSPPKIGKSVLVVCGPGNNGGDGLVAARHLAHFGHKVEIVYPKQPKKELYQDLARQCEVLGIPIGTTVPKDISERYYVIVDAIFGFSFKGAIRSPFDTIVEEMKTSNIPIASVDIPSGWDVEKGNVSGQGVEPHMLISLTAPKLCVRGVDIPEHWLGGRFVPPSLAKEYDLNLPEYPGVDGVMKL